MISNKYRQELMDFLNDVLKNVDIEMLTTYNSRFNFYNELLGDIDCVCKSGASKIVLWFEEFDDIVIKIPFRGAHRICGEYEDFYYAGTNVQTSLNNDWDYCEAEAVVFQEIAEDYPELTHFFCETEYLGEIKGHPFYIQNRVETIASNMNTDSYVENYSPSQESIDSLYDSLKDTAFINYSNDDVINIFGVSCDQCGIDLIKELIEFCENNIEDLHSSNYGFDTTGVIQIFDYCGFNE